MGVSEAGRSRVYATLAVRLSHSGLFRLKKLWKNAVEYAASVGGTCGLLLQNIGEGSGDPPRPAGTDPVAV